MSKNINIKRKASARLIAIAILSSTLMTGCNLSNKDIAALESKNISTSEDKANSTAKEEQTKLMESFYSLLAVKTSSINVIKFIDTNISKVSKEDASKMIIELEKSQKKNLSSFEDRFIKEEGIQSNLSKFFKTDIDLNKIDSVEDTKTKALLIETKDSGYKVEAAEGMFFPIINYEFYKKYSNYVTADIKYYIDIMAVESNKVSAKDAALVISWDEIVNRAISQEKFIIQYKDSLKLQDIKNLYNTYITFSLLGLNNTPLFAYDTKIMVPDAKKAYTTVVAKSNDSEYMKIISDYMKILEKNNYKLNDEVDKYRKGIIEKMSETLAQKPQVEVPYDLKTEENDQKSVDAGHSPWKLDPAFVAQVFVSLKISPEGIKGDYPIDYKEFKIVQINSKNAIVEVGGDKTPISKVFLKRLIRQNETGIWTVVGYDPVK